MKWKRPGAKKYFKIWRFDFTTWPWKQNDLKFYKYDKGWYIDYNIFQIRYER